jgi:HEAT repeat protein
MSQPISTNVRSISSVAVLARRLDECGGSDDYVAVIHALEATGDPRAVRVLAGLLDSTGPIAEASIAALVSFGEVAVPALVACTECDDYETIRHAHRALAALGHGASTAWLAADDADRVDAYLDEKGLTRAEWDGLTPRVANQVDEQDGVA